MIFLKLEDHGIKFLYPTNQEITDSVIGMWLSDNKIDYKVVSHTHLNRLFDLMLINELQFYNEEDVVAFKLRWSY